MHLGPVTVPFGWQLGFWRWLQSPAHSARLLVQGLVNKGEREVSFS